jgi:adenylate kinase
MKLLNYLPWNAMQNNKKYLTLLLFQVITLQGMQHYVLMGPPGAGKGTFADMLVQKYNYMQICPGALLRAEAAKGSPIGKSIKSLVEQAKPIESSIVCDIVQLHMKDALAKGKPFVLDGFPKNKECFDFFIAYMKQYKLKVAFMHFYADDTICFERMVSRLECHSCGATLNELFKKPEVSGICDGCNGNLVRRKGDDAETARYRLQEFHENIEPVIEEIKRQIPVIAVDTTHTPIDYCETLYKNIMGDQK